MATRRARPALASQAENARSNMGAAEKIEAFSWRAHRERAMKRESIIPSRHRRAESRCVRWRARPDRPRMKADEKANCTGGIRLIVDSNHKFLSRNQTFYLN